METISSAAGRMAGTIVQFQSLMLMSAEAIEESYWSAGIYALSNGEKFVLVSGTNTGKILIFQLDVDGVALRLMPEASQIRNALTERKKGWHVLMKASPGFSFPGYSLRCMEDLEKSLSRASNDQKQLNPSLRQGDIQVAVLEDIIQGMKDSSVSTWDDVVFIPPGSMFLLIHLDSIKHTHMSRAFVGGFRQLICSFWK
ncbi:UNVERIFIED_CONTAM: protein -like, chloroplastic [Sesamum calycinum]|uniref:Protein -like, chloroplastic n=1 Tax=Sesamum calycinum TaxID=2727403 RepID=A0AAW2RRT9_9LAMI